LIKCKKAYFFRREFECDFGSGSDRQGSNQTTRSPAHFFANDVSIRCQQNDPGSAVAGAGMQGAAMHVPLQPLTANSQYTATPGGSRNEQSLALRWSGTAAAASISTPAKYQIDRVWFHNSHGSEGTEAEFFSSAT
jgi:hypothetical protein